MTDLTHNPEVAGSSSVPATIKQAVFVKKAAVFITFMRTLVTLQMGVGVYLVFIASIRGRIL